MRSLKNWRTGTTRLRNRKNREWKLKKTKFSKICTSMELKEEKMGKKEMEEFLNKINAKKQEVKDLVNAGKIEDGKKAKEELIEMQDKFNLLMDLDDDDQIHIEDKVQNGTAKQVGGEVKPDKKNLVKSFVNIVRAGFLGTEPDAKDVEVYKDAISSDITPGSNSELGIGITIPEDIRTDIIELRRSADNLEQYVNRRCHYEEWITKH